MRVRPVVGALAFAVLVTAPAPAAAQTPIHYGITAGVNLAGVSGDVGDLLTENRTGFAAGGFAEIGLSPAFSIRPEVLYSQKGAKESEGGDEIVFKLTYIEIPVLAKYAIPMEGSLRPWLAAGPAVSFKAGCDIETDIGGSEDSLDCDETEFQMKSTDFSLLFGAGVDVGAFSLGIRYDLGLANTLDVDGFDSKNKTLSLMAGYTFGR